MGRPRKQDGSQSKLAFRPDIGKKIAADLRKGAFFKLACARHKIAHRTGQRWLQKGREDIEAERASVYADFAFEVLAAQANFQMKAIEAIAGQGFDPSMKKSAKGDARNLQWLLERLAPKEFGNRQRVEIQSVLEGEIGELIQRLKAGLHPETFDKVMRVATSGSGFGETALEPGRE